MFSAESFSVLYYLLPNVCVVDSDHGNKMIADGKEIAQALMGENSDDLDQFRCECFAAVSFTLFRADPFPGVAVKNPLHRRK